MFLSCNSTVPNIKRPWNRTTTHRTFHNKLRIFFHPYLRAANRRQFMLTQCAAHIRPGWNVTIVTGTRSWPVVAPPVLRGLHAVECRLVLQLHLLASIMCLCCSCLVTPSPS